ncbi:sulfur carrier protein ThiS [Planctomycetota bacterium]
MQITVNGKDLEVEEPATVRDLLQQLGIEPIGCAIELNRRIVRKSDIASTQIQAGDRIELVTLVGGG